MALGTTQPLVKMSTRNIRGGKGGRCVRLKTSLPSYSVMKCHEIWEPKPPGTLWATPGLLRDCFIFYTRPDLLIPGLIFVSERVDIPASWSCLLRSSVLMLVCTYSSLPATDESTSDSHIL